MGLDESIRDFVIPLADSHISLCRIQNEFHLSLSNSELLCIDPHLQCVSGDVILGALGGNDGKHEIIIPGRVDSLDGDCGLSLPMKWLESPSDKNRRRH